MMSGAPRSRPRKREWIAVLLIGAQIIGVARMPFIRDRFFAWSPHDQRTDVTITATTNGVPVSKEAIAARYGLPATDWHHAGNVLRTIEVAERRTTPSERWIVRLVRSVNDGPDKVTLIAIASSTSPALSRPSQSGEQ
jgi:hypothetical protein